MPSNASRTFEHSLGRQDYRLIDAGWRGEGMYTSDAGVLFVKTHDPMFPNYARPDFQPARAIYVIRNPFDAVRSYFHLETSGRHDRSLTSAEYVIANRSCVAGIKKI